MINQSHEISSDKTLSKGPSSSNSEKSQARGLMNVGGVLNGPQFMLVVLLVVVCVSSVWMQTDELRLHERYLRMYFNLNILGMDNQGFYEDGANIDQSSTEFTSFSVMCTVLKELANVTQSYHQKGVVLFRLPQNESQAIKVDIQYSNSSFVTLKFATSEDALSYFQEFQSNFTRDFLLNVNQFKFICKLGSNNFINNYQIQATFSQHLNLMVQADFSYFYDQPKSSISKKMICFRVIGRILASALLMTFVYRLFVIKKTDLQSSEKMPQVLRQKYKKWFIFMGLMNIVVFFSETYSPMAAWLQLLPIFQSLEEEQQHQQQSYNFNRNIRFSTGLIITIWVPLILFLNGFIFYSMLMYANTDEGYFSSYLYAFFDYMYQMFQVGTYEIFVEMQMQGPFAEILYAFLYFYVFEMGTTLIPALFVTLIQLKLNERDIAQYTSSLMKKAVCPTCSARNNYKFDAHTLHILVSSPKLTPLIKQKRIIHSPYTRGQGLKPRDDSKQILLQIEHYQEEGKPLLNKHKINDRFMSYSRKMQQLVRQLNSRISKESDKTELLKMQAAVQNYRSLYS